MKKIVWALFWGLCCTPVFAASFDCRNENLKNLTDIEIHICGDENISKQDERLSSLYRKIQAGSTATQRELLKVDQHQWLLQVRNVCTDRPCLGDAYRIRIGKLEELMLDGWQIWVSDIESFKELSLRSGVSEEELRQLYREQGFTQMAMNFGAFRGFIAVDLKMKKLIAQKKGGGLSDCSSELLTKQSNWEVARDQRCDQEADAEAEGGSMRPMIFSACTTVATEERILYLKSLKSCEAIR